MYMQATTTKDDCDGGGSIVMVAMQNKQWSQMYGKCY
jgi:hypothetical protein